MKINQTFNLKFDFLMNAQVAIVVPVAVVGNHWSGCQNIGTQTHAQAFVLHSSIIDIYCSLFKYLYQQHLIAACALFPDYLLRLT